MCVLLIASSLLSSCRPGGKADSATTATTAPATVSASPGMEPPVAFTQPAVAATSPDAGRWLYEETRTGYKAVTVSPTLLQFKFPYEGGSTASLTLRRRSGETHAYIEISKGQFNRSFQGGTARVRFDNRPAVSFPLVAAANGRANILFFGNEQQLIDELRTARRMVVTVEFAGQDTRDIRFNTADLRWQQPRSR
ncbi:hypothetical protein [Spirosoma rhododendri]|uniref:Uncharacterized protein n=1 Tax=Spirosoma rhododendri TaxID=2728024 RepID=A0A7L5DUC3_9BACT|nr:hypothetical protein [Spirosoma rhododendri]QJD80198.1 hypothetical protein HH216_18585 [Spirosoma rhododendri]